MRDDDKLLIVEDNPLIAAAIEKAGQPLQIIMKTELVDEIAEAVTSACRGTA